MPYYMALFEQKDIQPLNERYQDVNKNEMNFLETYVQTSSTMAMSQNYQNSLHQETTSHPF